MIATDWITDNYIEIFGAVAGIIYVFLEIRQSLWLWPVGIITSAVYIWVFLTGKLYADMSLQGYFLIISVLGWYWWVRGGRRKARGERDEKENGRGGQMENGRMGELDKVRVGEGKKGEIGEWCLETRLPSSEGPDNYREGVGNIESANLDVSRINLKTTLILTIIFIFLYISMWYVLDNLTDSPVPGWDAFITSLSIIATWMLARKIYEHWYLWMIVNGVAVALFLSRGLYPTVVLYTVYFAMSFIGLKEWKKSIPHPPGGCRKSLI